MKPSKRIEEIRKDMAIQSGIELPHAHLIPAILEYLDEEYERNKTIEQRQLEADYPPYK